MRKRKSLLIIVGTTMMMLAFMNCSTKPRVTVEEVNNAIQRETPLSSSRSQVEAFLNARNIEHSDYYGVTEEDLKNLRDDEPKDKRHLIRGRMNASIRNVEHGWISTWGIFIKFYFDDEGKLIDYRVEKLGSSL